jgi:hypothetical protein
MDWRACNRKQLLSTLRHFTGSRKTAIDFTRAEEDNHPHSRRRGNLKSHSVGLTTLRVELRTQKPQTWRRSDNHSTATFHANRWKWRQSYAWHIFGTHLRDHTRATEENHEFTPFRRDSIPRLGNAKQITEASIDFSPKTSLNNHVYAI